MTRASTVLVSAFILVASMALPALAEDSDGSKNDSGKKESKESKPKKEKKEKKEAKESKPPKEPKEPKESKPPKKSSGGGGGGSPNLAARGASFAAGLVFGTPIAVVRKTAQEIVQGTKDLVGDTDNWFLLAPAAVVATPFGCVSGGAGGAVSSIKNAWVGSEEPFSKDAFSLGDM